MPTKSTKFLCIRWGLPPSMCAQDCKLRRPIVSKSILAVQAEELYFIKAVVGEKLPAGMLLSLRCGPFHHVFMEEELLSGHMHEVR